MPGEGEKVVQAHNEKWAIPAKGAAAAGTLCPDHLVPGEDK